MTTAVAVIHHTRAGEEREKEASVPGKTEDAAERMTTRAPRVIAVGSHRAKRKRRGSGNVPNPSEAIRTNATRSVEDGPTRILLLNANTLKLENGVGDEMIRVTGDVRMMRVTGDVRMKPSQQAKST
jgi:hypothetical protein